MNKIAAYFLAFMLSGASPFASAVANDHVPAVAASVAAGETASQAALAASPVTMVAHSAGAPIQTGAVDCIANTMGLAVSTVSGLTTPIAIVAITGTNVAASGLVAYCLVTSDEQG